MVRQNWRRLSLSGFEVCILNEPGVQARNGRTACAYTTFNRASCYLIKSRLVTGTNIRGNAELLFRITYSAGTCF